METAPPALSDPTPPGGDLAAEGLLDALPWGVLVLDEQRVIRRVNQQAARWCGAPAEVLLNRSLESANLPAPVRTALLQLLETDVTAPREVFLAGQELWISLSAARQPGGWALYGQDITPQKQREQQYQTLAENTPDVLTRWTPDLRLRYANAALAAKMGQPLEALLGRTFAEMGAPADITGPYMAALQRVFATGRPQEHYHPFPGSYGPAYFFSRLVPELRDGQVETVLGIARDITELKHTQAEALRLGNEVTQRATDQYHSLFHSMDQGFCVLEVLFDQAGQRAEDFRYLELNPAFARQSGMPADVLGKTARQVLPDLEGFWFETCGSVALTGETVRVEHYVPPLDRWLDVHAFRVGPPEARRVAVLFNDITARKNAETSLRRAAGADAFRLRLVDALGPLTSPVAIEETITRLTRLHFNADRCYYCEITDEQAIIRCDAAAAGLPSAAGTYPLTDFGQLRPLVAAGRPFAVSDLHQAPNLDEPLRQQAARLGVVSCLNVPLVKNGQPVGVLCLVQATPREWTAADTALATEVAERTWSAVERARTEQALAASEEKYRTLFAAVDDGFAILELLPNAHGQLADFVYRETNPAFSRHVGKDVQGRRRSEVLPENQGLLLEKYAGIIATGEPLYLEYQMHSLGDQWFQTTAARIGGAGSRLVGVIVRNITRRKRREANLAFLADLNVEFAPRLSAEQIMARVTERLAEYLQLSRCHLAVVDATGELLDVVFDWRRDAAHQPSVLGRHRIDGYLTPAGRAHIDAGQPLVLNGEENSPLINMPLRVLADMGFGSSVDVPYLLDGRWHFLLSVARDQPSTWTPDEVKLLQQLAARIYTRLERAQAEAALQDVYAQLTGVLESTHDAFYALDDDFRFTYINQRAAQLWGRDPERLLGQRYWEVFPQAVGSEPYRQHQAVAVSGQPAHFETVSPVLGIWIEVSIYRSPRGGLAVFFRDITARKRAEERQAFLLQLSDALRPLQNAADIQTAATRVLGEHFAADRAQYWEAEPDGEHFVAVSGYAKDGPPSTSRVRLSDLGPYIEDAIAAGQPLAMADATTDPRVEAAALAAHEGIGARSYIAVPLVKEGRLVAALGVYWDQARPSTAEEMSLVEEAAERTWAAVARSRAEEAQRESEQRLRAVIENLPGAAVFIVDRTLHYQLAEGAALRQAGYEAADFVGHPVQELAPPELWPMYQRLFEQALAGQPFEYEHEQNGRAYATRGGPLHDADGAVGAVLAVSYDITARKQAEAAVQASETRFRVAEEAANGFIYDWTAHPDVVTRSAGIRHMLGYAPEDLGNTSATWLGLIHPDDQPAVARWVPPPGDAHVTNEYRVRRVDGSYAYVLDRSLVLRDAAGQVARIVGSVVDISDRRQAEAALQESERKYRNLFDSMDEGYCIIEMLYDDQGQANDWRYVEVNPAFEKNNGLTNATGKTIRELTPNIEPKWFATYGRVAQTGQPLRFEEDSAALGRCFTLYAFPVGAPGSHLVAVLFTDITARKQAEDALRLSEARLSLALQAGRMGSFEWTSDGDRISLSAMSEEVLGLRPGMSLATSVAGAALLHPDDYVRHRALFDEAGRTGQDFHSIFRIVRPIDGEVRWIEERGQGTRDPATGVVCLRGVHWDVTEAMLAQQRLAEFNSRLEQRVARRTRELQASRDLLQTVFDTNLIAMSVQEAVRDETGAVQDFRLRLVSGELMRETGRTDLVGKLYAQEYPGIREAGIFDLAVRALETGQPQGTEYFYPHDGFNKWFACQFVKLGDNGIVATNLDITERKIAEQERLRNLRLLEQAEAVAGLGSWDYDRAAGIMRWSDGMYQLFGLPVGSRVEPSHYLAAVLPADRPRAKQLVRRLRAGEGFEETLRLRVGGQVKTVRMKAVPLPGADGLPARVLGVDLDISELQRLEADNLHLRLTQQRALFEAVQAAQEAERKKIAESLHNGLGQILYATKLRLDQLHAPLLGTAPALAAARREADQLLSEAIRQTRALSHELVPMVLAEFGLPAALKDISRKMSIAPLHLHSHVLLDDGAAPMAPDLELALYRIAQELAQNIVKHARGATEAQLELETMPGWALLRAEDNGPGFAAPPDESTGLGLRSIRDRVALLGGQLEMGNALAGGAYVRIRIPIPPSS
ncbi:PAS domain-containing protein [Hymenobacter properus]|uniref:histidine kinase n=1 Tax=Hymenobacter properus TaxID=2791026 RepID=A0A931FNF1_9BACT|nr:PAS domain-containing protein [Hymenobacter properus]MBF9144076.1 PAS domain-containing protein [Hymenobacter properus]MBR7722892.1 PAS domain-containing protein [Microvirga sp. SRT04]